MRKTVIVKFNNILLEAVIWFRTELHSARVYLSVALVPHRLPCYSKLCSKVCLASCLNPDIVSTEKLVPDKLKLSDIFFYFCMLQKVINYYYFKKCGYSYFV